MLAYVKLLYGCLRKDDIKHGCFEKADIYLSNDQKGLSVILLPLIWKNPLYLLEPFFGSSVLATNRKERAQ